MIASYWTESDYWIYSWFIWKLLRQLPLCSAQQKKVRHLWFANNFGCGALNFVKHHVCLCDDHSRRLVGLALDQLGPILCEYHEGRKTVAEGEKRTCLPTDLPTLILTQSFSVTLMYYAVAPSTRRPFSPPMWSPKWNFWSVLLATQKM